MIFGSSCKAYATLSCDDVHHGPLPIDTVCMCAACLNAGNNTEAKIRNSYAPPPIDPEDDEYGPAPTKYEPDASGLKGGLG